LSDRRAVEHLKFRIPNVTLTGGVGRFLPLALLLAAALIFYARGAATNPPGFFLDESSIAFNAHTVSQSGVDEYGESLPLYFRAFGEYKNPVYIYLLAGVYTVTGPSIAAARFLSAVLVESRGRIWMRSGSHSHSRC
jgi:hypothetical protein